jgi:hypothetical protein
LSFFLFGGTPLKRLFLAGLCLGAAVLLVLASLTNVIAYQSEGSFKAAETPLFSQRTLEAINGQTEHIQSRYLGSGAGLPSLPLELDKKTLAVTSIAREIKAMDDVKLQRLSFVIARLCHSHLLLPIQQSVTPSKVYAALTSLKTTPEASIQNAALKVQRGREMRSNICTIYCTMEWEPDCIFGFLLFIILVLLDILIYLPVQFMLQLLTISC